MIGTTISHYEILEKLGEGGMGVVYKARDVKLKRFVALKFLPSRFSANEDMKRRFIREAEAASALDHTHICTIHEIDETDDGDLFIAMGFYGGDTLKQKIEQGPLPVKEAVAVAAQVALGLEQAHAAGIVHRDIKPANVIVTDRGGVKILDFGLAKLTGMIDLTKTGSTLGTVAYMSPEQAGGAEVDHRTDIWSWGVMLYEMLTGERPFRGHYEQAVIYSILNEELEPVASLRTDVPAALEQIVRKALMKDVADRYQRVEELLADLGSVRNQLSLATETPPAEVQTSPLTRIPRPIMVAGVAVLIIIIAVAFLRSRSPVVDPEYLTEWMGQGIAAYDSSDFELAIEIFGKIRSSEGVNKELRILALEHLARSHAQRGENEQANVIIRQILDLDPDHDLATGYELSPFMQLYFEAKRTYTLSQPTNRSSAGEVTLAVLAFEVEMDQENQDQENQLDSLGWGVSGLLIYQLFEFSTIRLVDRENTQWILEKIREESGNPERQLIPAEYYLYGSVMFSEHVQITAFLANLETRKTIMTMQGQGERDNWYSVIEELGLKVGQRITQAVEETQAPAWRDPPTQSFDAAMVFLEGEDLLERGLMQEAYEKYVEALEYDPSYKQAALRTESTKQRLIGK